MRMSMAVLVVSGSLASAALAQNQPTPGLLAPRTMTPGGTIPPATRAAQTQRTLTAPLGTGTALEADGPASPAQPEQPAQPGFRAAPDVRRSIGNLSGADRRILQRARGQEFATTVTPQ